MQMRSGRIKGWVELTGRLRSGAGGKAPESEPDSAYQLTRLTRANVFMTEPRRMITDEEKTTRRVDRVNALDQGAIVGMIDDNALP